MAELIAIVGESGSGKTSSVRNLDPAKTFIISTTGKRPGLKELTGNILLSLFRMEKFLETSMSLQMLIKSVKYCRLSTRKCHTLQLVS